MVLKKDDNSTHAASRKAVAELRAEMTTPIVTKMRVCAQVFSCYERSAKESRRGSACLGAPLIVAEVRFRSPSPIIVKIRVIFKDVGTMRAISRNDVYSETNIQNRKGNFPHTNVAEN